MIIHSLISRKKKKKNFLLASPSLLSVRTLFIPSLSQQLEKGSPLHWRPFDHLIAYVFFFFFSSFSDIGGCAFGRRNSYAPVTGYFLSFQSVEHWHKMGEILVGFFFFSIIGTRSAIFSVLIKISLVCFVCFKGRHFFYFTIVSYELVDL